MIAVRAGSWRTDPRATFAVGVALGAAPFLLIVLTLLVLA